jgi:hypothetical protein
MGSSLPERRPALRDTSGGKPGGGGDRSDEVGDFCALRAVVIALLFPAFLLVGLLRLAVAQTTEAPDVVRARLVEAGRLRRDWAVRSMAEYLAVAEEQRAAQPPAPRRRRLFGGVR